MEIYKESSEQFNNFYKEHFGKLVIYFLKRGGGLLSYDDAEDLASISLIKYRRELKKRGSIASPEGFLYTIAKRVFADHCEYQNKHPTRSLECNVRLKGKYNKVGKLIDVYEMKKEKWVEDLENEKPKEDKFLPVRRTLSHPEKAIRKVAMLILAANLEPLKRYIKERFPFVVNRYKEMGPGYEVIKKGEILSENDLDNMYCDFNLLVSKIANKIDIDDTTGIRALKILLLSSNPWKEWRLLGPTISVKRFGERPAKDKHRSWFPVFSTMELGGVKKFMEFLENEKIKTDKWENLMPIATNKYLRYFYELPKENSVLERQVKRIREDVKEHDKALGDILKELEK